jgi:hypothetical protein
MRPRRWKSAKPISVPGNDSRPAQNERMTNRGSRSRRVRYTWMSRPRIRCGKRFTRAPRAASVTAIPARAHSSAISTALVAAPTMSSLRPRNASAPGQRATWHVSSASPRDPRYPLCEESRTCPSPPRRSDTGTRPPPRRRPPRNRRRCAPPHGRGTPRRDPMVRRVAREVRGVVGDGHVLPHVLDREAGQRVVARGRRELHRAVRACVGAARGSVRVDEIEAQAFAASEAAVASPRDPHRPRESERALHPLTPARLACRSRRACMPWTKSSSSA